jgi:hypothetical protein
MKQEAYLIGPLLQQFFVEYPGLLQSRFCAEILDK